MSKFQLPVWYYLFFSFLFFLRGRGRGRGENYPSRLDFLRPSIFFIPVIKISCYEARRGEKYLSRFFYASWRGRTFVAWWKMITHSNVAQRAVNLCKIGRSEWLSYEWFIEKTACIRESLVQRERMLDRWMESVGGKIGHSVNRGGGRGGRQDQRKRERFVGAHHRGFAGLRSRLWIGTWRERGDLFAIAAPHFMRRATSSSDSFLVSPLPPAPIPGNIFAQRRTNERTYFLGTIRSKRYREYFCEKCG